MKYVLIPVLIILMIMVVVSLVRGIAAFLHSTKMDLDSGNGNSSGPSEMQIRQNRMMFARIKYQLLAVAVVAVLLALSR